MALFFRWAMQKHPMIVAVELDAVVRHERAWLELAARNYNTAALERLMWHSCTRIQWLLEDYGLPTIETRMVLVEDDRRRIECRVAMQWEGHGDAALAVRDAVHRLYAPVAKA